MSQIDAYTWQTTLSVTGVFHYAYMRNNLGFMASEQFDPDESPSEWNKHRIIDIPSGGFIQEDTVTKWRWLPATSETLPDAPASAVSSTSWETRVSGEPFQGGVVLQDYWKDGFSELFDYTADQMVANDILWVEVAQASDYTSTIDPVSIEFFPSDFTEEKLRALIRAFQAKGIKVLMCPQIANITPPSSSEVSWWNSWFLEFGNYLNYFAKIAEEERCAGFIFNGGDTLLPGRSNMPADITSRWDNLIAGVRSKYSGKIGYMLGMNSSFSELVEFTYFKNIISSFDVVGVKMWDSLTTSDDPSQSSLYTAVSDQFNTFIKPVWDNYSKPIIFTQIAYPSAYGSNRGEDAFPADSTSISMWDTYDPTVAMDLVGQAKVYEAILKEVAARPYIIGTYIFGYTYWNSIDKNYSIRSKPAEKIVSDWYSQ